MGIESFEALSLGDLSPSTLKGMLNDLLPGQGVTQLTCALWQQLSCIEGNGMAKLTYPEMPVWVLFQEDDLWLGSEPLGKVKSPVQWMALIESDSPEDSPHSLVELSPNIFSIRTADDRECIRVRNVLNTFGYCGVWVEA